ncbi:MAG TPA: tetratricopeptide repeat protein [Pyrinomonadaceae bacterium]|nr:tetratricopeptide repeat protein [Pyrinomonadaceae bacterium]
MKLSSRSAPPRGATAAFALCLAAAAASPAVLAQEGQAGAPPQGPAPTRLASGTQPAQNERERRAQAYAKLLEGQRYFSGVRSGNLTVESVRRAQAAFQQAAELDPTLSEARTALAEISLYVLDDQQQAEAEALAAARINPDNLGARRVLSRVYTLRSKLGDEGFDTEAAGKAVAELRHIIRLSPSDAEGWALLAEFHLRQGRDSEAVEALRRWATLPSAVEGRFYQIVTRGRELSPDAANARLAEVYLRLNRPAEAVAAVRNALAIEPENQRYLELLGEALEAGDGADQATINELGRIVAQQPQNAVAVGMLARAQARAGRVEDAASTLRAGAAALRPGSDRDRLNLQLQLAQTFDDAERYGEAVAVYEELLAARNIKDAPLGSERDRRFASLVLTSVVGLWQRAGKEAEAAAAVERMRRLLGNNDPAADIQNVNLLRTQGKREQALEAAREARRRFPDETRLLRLEAFTLADLGRVDEAVALIRPRLTGGPGDYEEYLVLSSLLMSAGRGAEAVEAARQALGLASSEEPQQTTNALLMLSSAQERAGDTKGSEETLRRILAKDPQNATALNNLGYFLAERDERLEEALDMTRRAVRAEPTNPSFLDSLGWVYFKLGKLPEAERYLSDAARRNPASSTIQEHLGDLHQRLGNPDKARAAWRKALSLATEAADSNRIKAKLGGSSK